MGINKKSQTKKSILVGATIGTKQFIVPAIDTLVAIRPEFMIPWLLVKGFFGSLLDIQQEKVNEFVEFINENKEVFLKEIVETKEFQEGFIISFEQYLKQRSERKRNIIKNIFLGFTITKDKENFQLELMYDILNKLTPFNIYLLKKIAKSSITIKDTERNVIESDYDEIKLLEYIGLVLSLKRQHIEEPNLALAEKEEDIVFHEEEMFSLSDFGDDFIKFIKE